YDAGTVLELFDIQVAKNPDATAIISDDATLNYRELDERANRLANYLRKLGVGPDQCVGLCLERGLEMMLGVLGILKAGSAYVPLDPSYPAERLQFMLSDSKCSALLTTEALSQNIPRTSARLICLDVDSKSIERESVEPIDISLRGENLAYVIYTSGSTGWPKGVVMPHRALANLINWQIGEAFQPLR